jgi:NitT/TauT family transport system substrate-binding protein
MRVLDDLRRLAGGALLTALVALPGPAAAADTIRVAFGDIATVESLHFLAAVERAKEKGVDVEITYFKSEDVAAQAVVSGSADVGVGTPYALIQKVKAPIRVFLQLSTLRFYPIVNAEAYKTWKDLDGQEIAVHARGSGTEAIMNLMAQKEGIKYGKVSYVPGAEVRAGALLQGNIKASIVDAANRNMLMEKAPGKFIVLPLGEVKASDEALYANTDFLQKNAAAVDVLVEAILTTWREVQANPKVIVELREKYGLLPDATPDMVKEIDPFFKDLADAKALPVNGGGKSAAGDDLTFYSFAGEVEGNAPELDVAEFWDFGPLDRALGKLGTE